MMDEGSHSRIPEKVLRPNNRTPPLRPQREKGISEDAGSSLAPGHDQSPCTPASVSERSPAHSFLPPPAAVALRSHLLDTKRTWRQPQIIRYLPRFLALCYLHSQAPHLLRVYRLHELNQSCTCLLIMTLVFLGWVGGVYTARADVGNREVTDLPPIGGAIAFQACCTDEHGLWSQGHPLGVLLTAK